MERAQRLPADESPVGRRVGAGGRRVIDQAPVVPLTNGKSLSLVSRRVGNYQYSQQTGVLYDQLWVR